MTKPKNASQKVHVGSMSVAKLIRYLMDHGGTLREISEEIGLHITTVRRYVFAFRRENMVHVGRYGLDKFGRPHPNMKIWVWGKGRDKEYVPIPLKERWKRKRDNQRIRRQAAILGIISSTQPAREAA